MSDFEKWFRSLNANGKTVYFLGNEHKVSEMAWNHQQAIIDDLIYKAKLRESDHQALLVKYQATKKCWEDMGKECESLKAQLNNIETCYIEKKKQVDACAALAAGWGAITWDKTTHWTEGYEEGCYHCSGQIEEALRGAND